MISGRRLAPPLLALVVGLAASIAAAFLVDRAEEGRMRARFEGLADAAVTAIESRMLAQLTLLRGTAGLFAANPDLSRDQFRAYVTRLRLGEIYPGVLGLGYTAYAPTREALEARIAAQSGQEAAPLRHWPDGQRPGYSAILYLEPMNRRNAAALGYDMLSEPTRREAMQAAALAGRAQLSGRVQLVQEIDPVKQPGFLLYAPLYRRMSASASDRSDLHGWVYSPLRAHDLFGAIFAERDLREISVAIYDERISEAALLYRIGAAMADPAHATTRTMDMAGRRWVVRIASTPAFERSSPALLGIVVGTAGTLITLLIAALMFQQAVQTARVSRQVRLRTAELQRANRRLIREAAARSEAEEQVRQMQKMEAVGQLTGGIAHDFNNMLSVIIGNLDMAQRRLDDRQRLERAIVNAKEGAAKAAELTSRLLAFGRRQPLAPKVIDANQLLDGLAELLRRSLGATVRLEVVEEPQLWRIHADPTQLESAIVNIAINARDAMPGGGSLTIETANCVFDEAAARRQEPLQPGEYVMIALTDTGEGMPPEVAAKALEPFFTTKEVGRGTGLGLSQVYGFVRQSGGQLKILTKPGQGTTVKIFLPRYSGPADPAPARTSLSQDTPRGSAEETILVVEDEDKVREISTEALRELGYSVLAAPDAQAALAVIERHEVSLLFTDVIMPGMNGPALAEAARQIRPDLRLLFTTGYARDALEPEGQVQNGISLIQKPFTTEELARRIRQELDRPPNG